MRVLFILVPDPPDRTTPPHLQFERFLGPYYRFVDAGAEIVLASPDGGDPLMRGIDGGRRPTSDLAQRFNSDPRTLEALIDTLPLARVDAEDFDAGFCIGSGDGTEVPPVVIAKLLASGKPVATLPQWSGTPVPAKGLLLIGEGPVAPKLAADALIGALRS